MSADANTLEFSNGSEQWRSHRWLVACLYSPRNDIGVGAAFSCLDATAEALAIKPVKTELIFKDEAKARHPRWRSFKSLAEGQPQREIAGAAFYPSERQFHKLGYSEYVAGIQVRKLTSVVVAIPANEAREAAGEIVKTLAMSFAGVGPLKYGFVTFLTPAVEPVSFATGFLYLTNRFRFERSNEAFMEGADRSSRRMGRHHIEFDRDLNGSQTVLRYRLSDVYEWSLLSDGHLQADVGGSNLRDWLTKSQLGTLTALVDGVWLWSVPNARAAEARARLREHGLLTAPD